jgi:hypothetical protein
VGANQRAEPEVDAAVCALETVYLNELFMKKFGDKFQWWYDVIPHPFCNAMQRNVTTQSSVRNLYKEIVYDGMIFLIPLLHPAR